MVTRFRGLLIAALLIAGPQTVRQARAAQPARLNLLPYVNPFIGTGAEGPGYGIGNEGGHVFPGAAYPQGMVQWSPDTTSGAGGYRYTHTAIDGFSLTHFSGRGCSSYQDFPFMPAIGPLHSSPGSDWHAYAAQFSHADEAATPGFYHVRLTSTGIGVDLTVTRRTGLGTFTYPSSKVATMLIRVGGSATGNADGGTGIRIIAPDAVEASATSGHFCGAKNMYTVYMVARFDRPFAAFGTWDAKHVNPASLAGSGAASGAYLTFDTSGDREVRVKVGLSFVSAANAWLNLSRENPGWDFGAVRNRASTAWNSALNRIQVRGGTGDDRTIFYTALYHTLFHPNVFGDVNGQYMGFDRQVHTAQGYTQYENFAGWDIYRSEMPLLAVLAPRAVGDMMQSLIADAQQGGGGLPRWEVANDNSGGMVGDSADALIASAFAFGARHFKARVALQAMERGASDPNVHSGQYVARPGLADYLTLGYIPAGEAGVWGTAATTLEYTTDDFCIAQLARLVGDEQAYHTYLHRSANWRNLLNPAVGAIETRSRSGAFPGSYDPAGENGFVESDGGQYTWMVPYDLHALFGAMGGNARVVSRLDQHFTRLNAGPTSPYAFMGNEPELEAPWEYDFAGAPSHTRVVVRRIERELYHNAPDGLPGNDDSGALSSWYVWAAMGLYPEVPGVAGFALGSPLFPSITVHLGNHHLLRIEGSSAAGASPNVHTLSLNGRPYRSTWLSFAAVKNGALLRFR